VSTIVDSFQGGLSIREISRRTGQAFGTVRNHLVRADVHRVKHKRVLDGMATCNRCQERKSVEEFPALAGGKYQCRSCLNEANHVQQLRKQNCESDHYQALFRAQGGKCAICGTTQGHRSSRGRVCRLAVDHDHATGKVRGLLCNNCNRGLGRFKDSVKNLEAALRYLKREQ
jgi:hypothetical protein